MNDNISKRRMLKVSLIKPTFFSGNQLISPHLKSIIIPDCVTHIGDYAFNGCDKLNSITIPGGVITIGEGAFMSCKALSEITFLNGKIGIGKGALEYCESLMRIVVPQGTRTDFEKQLHRYKDIIVES